MQLQGPSVSTGAGVALACVLSAISAEPVEDHVARAAYLFLQAAQEQRELEDGVALRFSPDELLNVAAFVENERRCCSFYTFTIEVTPGHGPLWLRLTGPDGVKEIFRMAMAQLAEASTNP